jgi:hypothetical protein
MRLRFSQFGDEGANTYRILYPYPASCNADMAVGEMECLRVQSG